MRQFLIILLTAITCTATPAAAEMQRYAFSQKLMGTTFRIDCYATDKSSAQTAADAAFLTAQKIESACSDWTSKSEIRRVLAATSPQQISPMLSEIMRHALDIARSTNGAFDPTIGHHTRNWRRSRISGKLPTAAAISKAKQLTGWKLITLTGNTLSWSKQNIRIDLGGIAKGYAADKLLEVMQQHGIPSSLITTGGELRIGTAPPLRTGWSVGLLTLKDKPTQYLTLSNCALSTSGDLHQSIFIDAIRYSHIVDPSSGLGLTKRISATVIAPLGIHADPLATACCLSQPLADKLLNSNSTTIHLLITTPAGIQRSPHFPTFNTHDKQP